MVNIGNINIGTLEIRGVLCLNCYNGLDSKINGLAGVSIQFIVSEQMMNVRTELQRIRL